MPQIALCFTGHVRALKRTYENLFKNIVAPGNTYVTYFITWEAQPLETIRECIPNVKIITVPNIDHGNPEFVAWSKEITMHHSWRATYPDTTKCKFRYFAQYYLLREVARQIPLDNYDIVVRCRPDIRLNNSIQQYFVNILPSTVYFPSSPRHGGFGVDAEGCQNCICWGDSKSMKVFFNILDGSLRYKHTYFEPRTGQLESNVIHDESTLYKYLIGEGISVSYKEYTYEIIRSIFEGGNSVQHLEFFLNKLTRQEPFALIRPNDGEYMILQGDHFTNIDNWTFSGGSLREELSLSIMYAARLPNSYVGIPCPGCWAPEKTAWYINTYGLDAEHLTYGNIVCNKNWKPLIEYLVNTSTAINYIGPGTATGTPLNVVSRFTISATLLNNWDAEKAIIVPQIEKYVADRPGAVFFFSAGPISKILIPYLFSKYPTSTLIDVGSAFDPFLKGVTNRGYVGPGADLAELICDFKSGHN